MNLAILIIVFFIAYKLGFYFAHIEVLIECQKMGKFIIKDKVIHVLKIDNGLDDQENKSEANDE